MSTLNELMAKRSKESCLRIEKRIKVLRTAVVQSRLSKDDNTRANDKGGSKHQS
jgi:hypothetical protein